MKISFLVLTLLLLLTVFTLGRISASIISNIYITKSRNNFIEKAELEKAAFSIIKQLEIEIGNGTDAEFYITTNKYSTETITVSLKDISSRINPLFFRIELFEKTGLSSLLIPGKSISEFQEIRKQRGFTSDLNTLCSDFFEEAVINKYFTVFGYANINITAEDRLEELYSLRAEDPIGASIFRYGAIQEYRSRKELITETDLINLLGTDYRIIIPVINTASIINVNYVPEVLLREIMGYPFGGKRIENYIEKTRFLILQREYNYIDQKMLYEIIQASPEQERIYEYLGTKTWFWRAEAVSENHKIVVTAAVTFPSENIQVVEVIYE